MNKNFPDASLKISNSKSGSRRTENTLNRNRWGKTDLDNSSRYRLAVGVSGGGTTFEAIAEAVSSKKLKMDLQFMFADRDCGATLRAKKFGIPILMRNDTEDISEFQSRVIHELEEKNIDLVALAGYLRLFPIADTDPFLVLNSHPAAIPYFGGKGMWGHHVHEAVVAWAKKSQYTYPYTFSTIHIASSQYDRGPVVGIKSIEFSRADTPEDVAAKLLPVEHQNYVEVLTQLSQNQISYPDYPAEFIGLIEK